MYITLRDITIALKYLVAILSERSKKEMINRINSITSIMCQILLPTDYSLQMCYVIFQYAMPAIIVTAPE